MEKRSNCGYRVWLLVLAGFVLGYGFGRANLKIPEPVWAQQRVFRGETATTLQAINKQVEKIAAGVERIDARLARMEQHAAPGNARQRQRPSKRVPKGDRSP